MKTNPVYQVHDSVMNMQDNCAYINQLNEHSNMAITTNQPPSESDLARDLEEIEHI